jgi:glutathione S-transferase
MPNLTLISHALCPYVQRAAIVMAEKSISFVRREVDLSNLPPWFLQISPLGKTPVLLVDDTPIFESAVICEFLDDTVLPRLHPEDALQRARHRGWMEFGSVVLDTIGGFYSAKNETALAIKRNELVARFGQIEAELGEGPFFEGQIFTLVDAVFGPVFRYFDVFDAIGDFAFFWNTPKLQAWRQALASRASVRDAVDAEYATRLMRFIRDRNSALSARIDDRHDGSTDKDHRVMEVI